MTPINSQPSGMQIDAQVLDTNLEKSDVLEEDDRESEGNARSDGLEERSQELEMASDDQISVGVKDIQSSI